MDERIEFGELTPVVPAREFVVLDRDGVGITFWEPLAAGG